MTHEELYDKYPHLFARRKLDAFNTCFSFGIECDSGWNDIIDKLSDELSSKFPHVQYEQIKEKFGTLRIYMHGTTELDCSEVNFIVAKHCDRSTDVCEVCGSAGALRASDWRRVLCDAHNSDSSPTIDTRTRWRPEGHSRKLNGILVENLADGHLANIIRYMDSRYTEYSVYHYRLEAERRGLTQEFLDTEHPFTDEYIVVDGECVSKDKNQLT
jgi:hypothetical protein